MATSSHSSHPTFSYTDNIAATGTDFILLVGRVFLGWLFLAIELMLIALLIGALATVIGQSSQELIVPH